MTMLQDLAREARSWLAQDKRNDGTTFWKHKDDAPEWVHDLAREAHGDMFPDDWRYETIVEVLGALEDAEDPDNAYFEYEADPYNKDLLAWLASHTDRQCYVDESMVGLDITDMTIMEMIAQGQRVEKQEIHSLIVGYLQGIIDNLDDIEEDDHA